MLSKQDFNKKNFRPFYSVLLILLVLFLTAFFKITLRRLSYSLYQENRKFDRIQDEYYSNLREYGRAVRTDRLENLAKKGSLDEKKKGQIIQVIDGKALIID